MTSEGSGKLWSVPLGESGVLALMTTSMGFQSLPHSCAESSLPVLPPSTEAHGPVAGSDVRGEQRRVPSFI